MKDSTNAISEIDTSKFKVLPRTFMFFTPEEKEKWCIHEKKENVKQMSNNMMHYTGDGIIIDSDQIPNLDVNFAEIYNKFFSNKTVLIDIFNGALFKREDFEKIVKFCEKLKENDNDLLFYESATVYSVGEVLVANSKINDWADEINSKTIDGKPLSPLEKFYLAYDIVTEFEYNESNYYFDSRNLISVLQGTKIVCVGFAKLLSQLCKQLGIDCETQLVANKSKDPNHMNCIVRIKDEKYGVDGVFYSDPCWDAKKGGKKTLMHSLLTYKEVPLLFGDSLKIDKKQKNMNQLIVDSKLKEITSREEWQKVMSEFLASGKNDFLKFIDSLQSSIDDKKEPLHLPTKSELQEVIDLYITGVYSMKKIADKYADDKIFKNSLSTMDFMHKGVIEYLIDCYTTKEQFEDFKALLSDVFDDYCPKIASQPFDDLRKIYEIDEKDKNTQLVEKMKCNSKGLEFWQFLKLHKNLAKVYQGGEKQYYEKLYETMRVSLAKALGKWKNPTAGTNPVSKLAFVHQNKRSVHQVKVANYLEEFYDKMFEKQKMHREINENEMRLIRAIFGDDEPSEPEK